MAKDKSPKIDGYTTSVRRSHALRKFNISAEKLKDKLRCNSLAVAKLLYDDLRNAVNDSRKIAPCAHIIDGEYWLETSSALIRHRLECSVEPITITRNMDTLQRLGIIVERRKRSGTANGNNVLLKLDMSVVVFVEPKEATSPHPGKPPDKVGEADIDGLNTDDVRKLAKNFNRKHHQR